MKISALVITAMIAALMVTACNTTPESRTPASNLKPAYSHTEYINAIHQKILANWKRATYQMQLHPARCTINITQSPGGKINTVVVTHCRASREIKETIKQAVIKSSPLPYKGYEDVFTTNVVLEFVTN